MLIPKSLTIKNMGRFVDEQTVDFTSLGSFVKVAGKTGVGKSMFFKAWDFLFGFNETPVGVLQSRFTKEPLYVIGHFDYDGIPLTIERGKKLKIDENGTITEGSSKITEERLDQIIGMDRELFRKVTHKRQNEGGFFLAYGPTETHKFLTTCLGLEKEQQKIVKLDILLKTLTEQKASYESRLAAIQAAYKATETAQDSLGVEPVLDVLPEALEALKIAYMGASDNHKLVKDGHKREIDDLEKDRPKITSTPFDRSKIEALELEISMILAEIAKLEKKEADRQLTAKNKIKELEDELKKLHQQEKDRQTLVQTKISQNKLEYLKVQAIIHEGTNAKEEAIKLAEDLNKTRAAVCPNCERGDWVNDVCKAKETVILQKLSELKIKVIAGTEAKNKAENLEIDRKHLDIQLKPSPIIEEIGLNKQIQDLTLKSQPQAIPEAIEYKLKQDFKNKELITARQEERDHQNKETLKNQDVLSVFAAKQTKLRLSHESTITYVQNEEKRTSIEYEAAKNKVVNHEQSLKRYKENYQKLKEQSEKYNYEERQIAINLADIIEEIETNTECQKVIKSYLSCSFEDALDSIGDEATRLIRSIPNMATATIQFEGLKENKDGKVKEEVNCMISMDGDVGIPIKSLSGGERSSTDLAVDLAVIKFIEEKTGKGCSIQFLDEPFTGLNSENILEVLEVLKESKADKQLFISDHNPECAEFFENKLSVIRTGLISKIVQE